MGKIKRQRLKISRYSPNHLHNNGCSDKNLAVAYSLNKIVNKHPQLSTTNRHHTPIEGICSEQEINVADIYNGNNGGLKAAGEKISSDVPGEKVTGLNILAAFALEPVAAEYIIRSNMLTNIPPLLRDQSSQVRLATAGVLRNLCSWGSDENIDLIVQQDVMQPLSNLLKTYEANVPPSGNSSSEFLSSLNYYSRGVANSMEESDPNDLIFIHAANVLWSLCECNEEALSTFNRDGLVTILLNHINPYVWGFSISLAAADCLLCVSENNPKTTSAILPLAATLGSLVTQSLADDCDVLKLHYAVVISGVLLNVNYWGPGEVKFRQMFEVLSKVMDIDAFIFLNPDHHQLAGTNKASAQENFEHVISSQLVAFEILSNICCYPEEDEDEEDDYGEFEEDSDGQRAMTIEEEEESNMDAEQEMAYSCCSHSLSIEDLETIKYYELVGKTLKKIMAPPPFEEIRRIEDEALKEKSVLLLQSERLCQLRIRSLQCFQNLTSCLPTEDLGGSKSIFSTWLHLGKMSFCNSNQIDANLLEAVTGSMRAIIEKLSESNYEELLNISSSDLQPIFTTVLACGFASVRGNICRMIGTLGCSVIRQAKDVEKHGTPLVEVSNLVTSITNVLLQVSREDGLLWVRAEAIDVLIDLFSDDTTDKLAAQVHLVEKLKEIHPQFKAKFNQERKKLGDHRPLVLTVKDNLIAFIKYKGPRALKFSKMGC